MPRKLDPRKTYYRDVLHQHIADNPERFLDLGGEAERIGPPPESESDPEAERAFYAGFNSGEGGLRNRLENARDEAATAALAGAVLPPAAHATGQAAAHVAGAALDLPTKRVIGKITQTPEEADALLEKACLLRRIDVNDADVSWPETGSTAYDLAFKKGERLGNEMKVLHQGLYGQGYQTSDIPLTRARMDRVGAVFVGPGYKAKPNKKVLSADKSLRYRGPATKPRVYATGQPGVQANLERDRIMKNRYRHNLHINIFDMLPTIPAQP